MGLFATCVVDVMFPNVARATAAILERLGHEVEFPTGQTCCGQMHINSGYPNQARRLAERFIRTFVDYDLVIAPSSSCVGTVRHLYPTLLDERRDLFNRVFELSEALVGPLAVTELGARFAHRVTYHPTCHSLRAITVGDAPLTLLRSVQSLELVDLKEATECCGFGGTFSLKNADTSAAILSDKCGCVAASAADFCTALDCSCLMHIQGGLSRRSSRTRTIHLAEVLASR